MTIVTVVCVTTRCCCPRCQAKYLTCEISDFTPCKHAQSNILRIKYADKTYYSGLGIRV